MANTKCPGQDMSNWKFDDIFEVECACCGAALEFFKDETRRRCKSCGAMIMNPRIEQGCAQWCAAAEQCMGKKKRNVQSGEAKSAASVRGKMIAAMKQVFGADTRRIAHALKVLEYAEEIMRGQGVDEAVVVAAAALHDIGIHEAEKKHGSSAGKYQEIEGPPIACGILSETSAETGLADEQIEHICKIVANHHSARDIDTPEFRAVWDADWIVNIPDEQPDKGKDELENFINKVFRTDAGRKIGIEKYCK
jgi:hypothetical protein